MIIDCKPVGTQILIENLTNQETLGTKLHITGSTKSEIPQAVILAIGPNVDVDKLGFQVGDRIILVGTYVPVPSYGEGERTKGLVDPHMIKGILIEADE